MNIISTTEIGPAYTATTIIETTPHGWGVACEGGCGKNMWVSRKEFRPVDFAKPNGDYNEIVYIAPSRRTCALCGIPGGVKPVQMAPQNKNIEVLSFGFYEMKKYSVRNSPTP